MRSSQLNLFTWLTGYSGWAFYCALCSTFGLAIYYSDLLRGHVPDWVGVGLLIPPIVIPVLIRWGEAPDRVVTASHIIAASWYMVLTIGMEIGIFLGYEPRGSVFLSILAHFGWAFAWAGIYRQARRASPKIVKPDAAGHSHRAE